MSFALPVLSLPLHRHPLNAQAALAKIDMPACRQAGARKIARVILERRHLFVVNFRVFAGARIRKFSARGGENHKIKPERENDRDIW